MSEKGKKDALAIRTKLYTNKSRRRRFNTAFDGPELRYVYNGRYLTYNIGPL